jgi:hypothetical protein
VKPKREHIKPDIEKHPLGELLKTFSSSGLDYRLTALSTEASIADVEYAASYNWRHDGKITVLVPGK